MYNWKLVPTKSIGDINFGMDRLEVRALFSGAFEEFKKTEDSDETQMISETSMCITMKMIRLRQ